MCVDDTEQDGGGPRKLGPLEEPPNNDVRNTAGDEDGAPKEEPTTSAPSARGGLQCQSWSARRYRDQRESTADVLGVKFTWSAPVVLEVSALEKGAIPPGSTEESERLLRELQ